MRIAGFLLIGLSGLALSCSTFNHDRDQKPSSPDRWRAERRVIDLHQHINSTTQHIARAVRVMDQAGIGVSVNLSGGVVTRGTNAASPFERNKRMADGIAPGRFLQYMNLDYRGWDEPDFSARAVQQIEEGHRLGAAGLK